MSVEVYRQWRGGLSTRRPPRPWSYLWQRRPATDSSTRHDPATAIAEEPRWYDFIDGPISLLVVPLLLVLVGLARMIGHYLLVLLWTVGTGEQWSSLRVMAKSSSVTRSPAGWPASGWLASFAGAIGMRAGR